MNERDLDDLFASAQQQPVSVSADLMARVLVDADAHLPLAETRPSRKPQLGFLAGLLAAIGGAGGLAGLSTAALAGVWIGFAQPTALTSVTDAFLATQAGTETTSELVDILPGFDDFLSEG